MTTYTVRVPIGGGMDERHGVTEADLIEMAALDAREQGLEHAFTLPEAIAYLTDSVAVLDGPGCKVRLVGPRCTLVPERAP